MNSRLAGVPIVVFIDAKTRESRCVNGLHVQTFVPNPFWDGEQPRGTLITFANGDTVTVAEEFDAVVDTFMGGRQDG
jgi:hypothetical protein